MFGVQQGKGRAGVLATGGSLVLLAAAGQPAQAALPVLPPCKAKAEIVTSTVPAYLRPGGTVGINVERRSAAVTAVSTEITNGPLAGQTKVQVFPFGKVNFIRLLRPIPKGRKSFYVRVFWRQGVGTSAACSGQNLYPRIPVIPLGSKVGDPHLARVAGRWKVLYRLNGKDAERSKWRLRPACDFFGCRTRVKSTAGLDARLVPIGHGRYRLTDRLKYGTCQVTFKKKKKGKPRRAPLTFQIFRDVRMVLHPENVTDGVAHKMRGTWVARQSIPTDKRHRCVVPPTQRRVVAARRL